MRKLSTILDTTDFILEKPHHACMAFLKYTNKGPHSTNHEQHNIDNIVEKNLTSILVPLVRNTPHTQNSIGFVNNI